MIEKAGWRANEPNKKVIVFEAEWDCKGDIPVAARLLKNNASECPEQVERAVVKYYTKLRAFLENGEGWKRFSDFENFADVWSRLKSLPEGVTFPEKIGGSLCLRDDLKAKLKARK